MFLQASTAQTNTRGVDSTSIFVARSRRLKVAAQRVPDQIGGAFLMDFETARRHRVSKVGLYL